MPVTHINRKGRTYYLHRGTTKAGQPTLYFSLRSEGDLAAAIPEGYEVYEHPNGQVFLRRVRPQIITPDEVGEVEREIERYPRLKHSRVDVQGPQIVVFVPSQDEEELTEFLGELAGGRSVDIAGILARGRALSPELRFVLVDEERRLFQAQRFCYLGSIDDWIDIGERGRLEDLVQQYVQYLRTEAWFELF